MLILITAAAAAAAQPATAPAPAQPVQMGQMPSMDMSQMDHSKTGKLAAMKDCSCKDMAKMHEGHAEDGAKPR
jgi:hypothetical protein